MSDFRLNVIAETQAAERKLQQVEKLADRAVKSRSLNIDLRTLNRGFADIKKDVEAATNNIRTFYSVSKNIPGVGDKVRQFEDLAKTTATTAKQQFQLGTALKESAQAGNILARSLDLAGTAGGRLINILAKVGFATFALKEAVGVVQAAWNGFFNNTIGREIKLRETILKTQTTLASTNKVFANGREITDPYQKIVNLTGEVGKHIDSIRERSIALAGVTSNDVIEVFGIVASQVGQIGAGLKEAEDLAINFAAALGTFGIPLYQARQEVGSILRGDITMDSYLAKALGITNEDIARAKSEAGGVVKFLEDRLAAAVAGQKIAAEGFSGVVSNIADLGELIGQNFGRGLLDPLLAGLSSVFETLFRIRTQLFSIAEGAGRAIGTAGRLIVGLTAGRAGLGVGDPSQAAAAAAKVAERGFQEVQSVAQRTVGAITQAIEALKPTALILVDAFRNIAEAFVAIKVGTFEALASALANIASVVGTLSQPLATVFNLYARFLNTPAVRYFSEVAAVLGLLKRVGLDAVTQLVLFGRFIVSAVVPAIGTLGTALAGLIAGIAAVALAVGKLILVFAGLATALVGPAAAIPALAAGLKALSVELLSVGKQAVGAGAKIGALSATFRGAGAAAKAAGLSILASLGWIFVIQIGIAAIIDAFGRFQRAQEDQRSNDRAREALRRLQTTYRDVGDSADSATKAARDFEQAIVNANYTRSLEQLEEVRKKINQIRYELKPGIQSWGEFWDALSGSEVGRFEERSRQVLQGLLAEEQKIKEQLRGVDAQRDREEAEKNIRLEAAKRVNLEKEIGEIKRQQESQLFQQRQALAQREVEIFRASGELRIFQMEQANAKLIEGEEGASRAALEALNNYLSTRERGELDIESAKQNITIEIANLERQISDYRYENEKRIAEIRKRAGDYEKNVADYRRQMAAATGAAPGVSSGFRVGSTGSRSTGPHLDLRGPDKEAVIREAVSIIKAWQGQNVEYIVLSNAKIDVKNMTDESALIAALRREQVAHDSTRGRRPGASGNAVDIAVPSGTLVPVPAGTPYWGGAGGWQATSLNTGNTMMHGLESSVASPVGRGSQPAAPTPPQSPTFADLGAPAVEKYSAAVRSLAGAMERLRALQAALTEARTAAAFEEIAKAAFPAINVEQYRDQLIEAQTTLDAFAETAGQAYDPEALKISVDAITKRKVQEAETAEILKTAQEQRAKGNISEAELLKIKEGLDKRQADFVKKLEDERKLRQQVLEITRQQSALDALRRDRAAIPFDLQRAQLQATGTMAQAFFGEDPRKQRQLEAETRIAERRTQLEQDQTKSTEQINAELTAFAIATRAAATTLGDMDVAVRDFQRNMTLIRESARTFTEGYKGFFKSILTGGDVSSALTQMLESVADRFLSMALDAAFAPVEQMLTENFKQFFGVEDPMQALQQENNLALTGNTSALTPNTAALNALTAALGTAAAGSAAGAASVQTGAASADAAEAATEAADATNAQADATERATEASKNAASGLGQFQAAMGSVMSMAAGAASIAGGIGMMGKGGTYNTLMGLAGIFGGIGSIAGGFNGLGKLFKADGGPIAANRPYIVGEEGPELIIPQANGTVLPNSYLRGGNSAAGAQLPAPSYVRQVPEGGASAAAAMSGAITAATAAPSKLEFAYESTVINNVEYVTAEQFQRGLSDAAERGRSLTLGSLQNSVRTRKRVGI